MKRFFLILLSILLVFGLFACKEKPVDPQPDDPNAGFAEIKTLRGVLYGLDDDGGATVIGISEIAQKETALSLVFEPAKGYRLTAI